MTLLRSALALLWLACLIAVSRDARNELEHDVGGVESDQ
jgi:hypothetical protein